MSALFAQKDSVVPHTGVDFSNKRGYLVSSAAGVPAITDSATVPAFGVLLEAEDAAGQSSIGILGAIPPARAKLGGSVDLYQRLQQKNDGTLVADTGAGSRVIVAVALEAGESGDLAKVQFITPIILS